MPAKTFDNESGGGDGYWDVIANWDPEGVPVGDDTITISADCACRTDQSAVALGAMAIGAGFTLTVEATGKLYVTNADVTVPATAALAFDGGLFRLTRMAGTIGINLAGSITGSANGGTLQLATDANSTSRIVFTGHSADITGNSGSPLAIVGDTGTARGDIYNSGENLLTMTDLALSGLQSINLARSTLTIDTCACDDCNYGIQPDDSYIRMVAGSLTNGSRGILMSFGCSYIELEGCTFSGNSSSDVDVDAGALVLLKANTTFGSGTPTAVSGNGQLVYVRKPRGVIGGLVR